MGRIKRRNDKHACYLLQDLVRVRVSIWLLGLGLENFTYFASDLSFRFFILLLAARVLRWKLDLKNGSELVSGTAG